MNAVLNNIMETGELNPIEKPVLQAQEPFKQKAFCIVGDEMKAKIEALVITENDIAEISCENENHEFLELIDVYFHQMLELKKILQEKYAEEYTRYKEDMSGYEFQKMINDETKRSLLAMLSYHNSLFVLFSKYPDRIKDVFKNKGDGLYDFLHLLAYSKNPNKYQFDFDLAVNFFELAEKIERERMSLESRFDLFDGICDAYENLSKKIKTPELFNDLLKLVVSNGSKSANTLIRTIKEYHQSEIEDFYQQYDTFIKLGIIAGRNNSYFLEYTHNLQLPQDETQKNNIIAGFEILGPDFIYAYKDEVMFKFVKKYPDIFLNFCSVLKKISESVDENVAQKKRKQILGVSYTQEINSHELFYALSLKSLSQFYISYPDAGDFLISSAEILGKYTPNVMGTGIKFLEVLYTKFPDDSQEILQKITQIGMNAQNGADVLFMSSGLNFLSKYLEKDGKQKVFQMAEKMVELGNKYLTENNNGAFYSQKENPLTYGLGFLALYLDNFGEKYDEILERVMMLIGSSGKASGGLWEKYFLGMSDFIREEYSVSFNPEILHDVLDFYEKIYTSQKEVIIQKGLKIDTNKTEESNKDIDLIFKLLETDFSEKNIKTISNVLVWLLQNNQNEILPFIKLLFIIGDLSLKIDLSSIFDGEINDENFIELEKQARKKLKNKSSFQHDKIASYDEIIQQVFGERIDETLKRFEKFPEVQREDNIQKINSKHKENLRFYRVNTSGYDENHRTLVLYYRAENMDSFHFSFITHILHNFINGGHSKVFDRLLITSRGRDNYPHEVHQIGEIPYEYDDFKRITNIFANTIHFTHGTVIEDDYMYTTPHIIGLANLAHSEDKKRVPDTGFYVPLYLKYGKTQGSYTQEHIDMDKSRNFEDIFDEIIRAVRACEDMMIKNIK